MSCLAIKVQVINLLFTFNATSCIEVEVFLSLIVLPVTLQLGSLCFIHIALGSLYRGIHDKCIP